MCGPWIYDSRGQYSYWQASRSLSQSHRSGLKSNWRWKEYRWTESNPCLSEMESLGKEGPSMPTSICTSQFHSLLPLSVWTAGSCKSCDLTENGQNLTCSYSDILMLVVFDILSGFLTMFWYLSLKLTSLKKKKNPICTCYMFFSEAM